ncbi:hypothetical protein LTR95_009203 [Oleoguttula sp. CCFEE 5521]
MSDLGQFLDEAVAAKKVPQVVTYATNADGSFTYSHTAGTVSTESDAAKIKPDAIFLLASATKLIATIAALQIVEKGLIGLEDDVSKIIPELGDQEVLHGFAEDGEPILKKRQNAITLRHLLTHSAGTAYDMGDAGLIRLAQHRKTPPSTGTDVVGRFSYPLIFEPGTSWSYGTGIDWAGLVVERLTNSTLEGYMTTHIWQPLGIKEMTFFPRKHPELQARIPVLAVRTPDGGLAKYPAKSINEGLTGCLGGQGIYATMDEYLRVQRSILANDGKLLSAKSVDLMFTPQLTSAETQGLKNFLTTPMAAMFIGEFVKDLPVSWGLGGVLFLEDDDGRRKKGTMSWGGMTNPFWIIDREAGLALVFGTQLFPPGDLETAKVITTIEKSVYKMVGVA